MLLTSGTGCPGSETVVRLQSEPVIIDTTTARDSSPAWHRRLRKKRSQARQLLKKDKARRLLEEHHGSSPPMPPWGQDVLPGPTMPHWGCPGCGRPNNWASRIRCACGQQAPQLIVDKARAAAKKQPGHQGPAGSGLRKQRAHQDAGSTLAQLERRLQLLELENARLREGGKEAGQQQEQPEDDETTKLRGQISDCEAMVQKAKAAGMQSIQEAAEAQLAKYREELMASKPAQSRHAAVSRKLAKARQQRDKLQEAAKATEESLRGMQTKLAEDKAALAAKVKEIEALEIEFQSTAQAAVPKVGAGEAGHVDFALDKQYLEQDPELGKWMESPMFQKFKEYMGKQELDRAKAAAKQPEAPRPQPSKDAMQVDEAEQKQEGGEAEDPAATPCDPSDLGFDLDGLLAAAKTNDKRVLEQFCLQQGIKKAKLG